MKTVAGALGGAVTALLGLPLVWSVVGGLYRVKKAGYTRVARLDSLPEGEPKNVGFQLISDDAYIRAKVTHDVWCIRQPDGSVTVFSPICTHLGCHYNWDAAAGHFVCPCHGSVFALDGRVLGGPAPRPLDTLPHKVEDGELYVQWERFETGIPKKVRIS